MNKLSTEQLNYLRELRHALHRQPEVSGQEQKTAARITQELLQTGADQIWQSLGGHGVAAEYRGHEPGPTVLLRCELDGLPITEISTLDYQSEIAGRGHLCGHDGHMCMVLGVGRFLGCAQQHALRPKRGRLVLLFQPAEETGFGAQAVIDDARWPEIRPDYAFAFHNLPGRPLAEIGLRTGPANCASRGMQIKLHGKSSHAAAPEDGLSPGAAIAQLIQQAPALSSGTLTDSSFGLCTPTHAQLGEPTFGISPGDGEVRLTLRAITDERMQQMVQQAQQLLDSIEDPLHISVLWHDIFLAAQNSDQAIQIARTVATEKNLSTHEMQHPMSWSEDFGRFGLDGAQAALLFLGAGEQQPQLHNPDYDFPDALLAVGTELLLDIVDHLLVL